jgi:hypothetical protein
MQDTDIVNMTTLLRIIQSIKHKNAEPFKQWLADVGAQKIQESEVQQLRVRLRRKIQEGKVLIHQTVHYRGVTSREQHQQFDEEQSVGLYGMGQHAVVYYRHLPMSALPPDGLPNFISAEEMGIQIFYTTQLGARIEANDSQGEEQIFADAHTVGKAVREILRQLHRPMPEDLPAAPMLKADDWQDEDESPKLPHYQTDWTVIEESDHMASDDEVAILFIDNQQKQTHNS